MSSSEPSLVGADGGHPEVDGIRDAGGQERRPDHDPLDSGVPAGQPEDAGDEPEQDDVAERVGEVGGDRDGLALGVIERDLEQERRSDGPHREGDADAVEPDAAVEVGQPRADEQQERHVRRRVEEEVERIGERRDRSIAAVREGPDEVADAVGGEPRREPRPGGTLVRHQDRPGRDCTHRERLEPVVHPDLHEIVGGAPAHTEAGVKREDAEADDRGHLPGADRKAEDRLLSGTLGKRRNAHGVHIGDWCGRHERFATSASLNLGRAVADDEPCS